MGFFADFFRDKGIECEARILAGARRGRKGPMFIMCQEAQLGFGGAGRGGPEVNSGSIQHMITSIQARYNSNIRPNSIQLNSAFNLKIRFDSGCQVSSG